MKSISSLYTANDIDTLPVYSKDYTRFNYLTCLKMVSIEFNNLIPVLSLLLHYTIVVNMSSECSKTQDTVVSVYLYIIHLFTFVYSFILNLPSKEYSGVTTREFLYSLLKAILITFQFFTWSLIRAKPYKCLINFSPLVSVVLFIFSNIVSLGLSVCITKYMINN